MEELKAPTAKPKRKPKPSKVKVKITKGYRQSAYHIGQIVDVAQKEADILINDWKIAEKV